MEPSPLETWKQMEAQVNIRGSAVAACVRQGQRHCSTMHCHLYTSMQAS